MEDKTIVPVTATVEAAETLEVAEPSGMFVTSQKGLFAKVKDKDGNMQQMLLCSPLTIVAGTRDEQQENWGCLIELADPDGHVHRINILMSNLSGSGDTVIADLMSRGLKVNQLFIHAKKFICAFLQEQNPPLKARNVLKTGWHNHQFVLPEQVIGKGAEMLLYQKDASLPHAYQSLSTLGEWQQLIGRYCIGNSRLVLAVSVAFASPLLHMINAESGGISITGGSSTGKTTALHVAASVCGSPAYVERWRATDNGLESVAMQHNDTVLILDELAQIDPKLAGETAYMLGNGCGKIRANKSGNAKIKAVWRLLYLSAGEISLTAHMAAGGKVAKAGQEIRLVDVPADAGAGQGLFEDLHGHLTGADFSEALKLSSSRYYGTPLVAFLERLTGEDYYIIKNELEKFQKQFISLLDLNNAGGQAQRVAARFAIIAAAGELASSFSITGWEAGEAIKAVKTCYEAWVDNREGTGQLEHRKMVEQLQHYLENYGESRFSPFDASDASSKTIQRSGFRKLDPITGINTFYILPGAWDKDICAGFNKRDMTAYLLANGYLVKGTDGKATQPVRLPGMDFRRCYRVCSSVFAANEATFALQETGNTGNEGNIPFDDNEIPF